MRVLRAVLILAAVAGNPTPSSAATLQPTGKWVVNYDRDECLLERDYGTEAKPLALLIERFPMDTDLAISVFSRHQGRLEMGRAKVTFGAAAPIIAGYGAYPLAHVNFRQLTANIDDGVAFIGNAVTAGTIAISAPGEGNQVFAVPDLGNALKVLDVCVLDLGTSWGVPVAQQQRMKTPAEPIRHDYLQSSDYPSKELNAGANGRSLVRLTVDENGKPLECIPLKSADSPVFAQTSCRLLLKRASFHPAKDADGKPMRSIVVYPVSWIVAG